MRGPTTAMDFSEALRALRAGKRVRRAVWAELSHIPAECAELALVTLGPPYDEPVIVATTWGGGKAVYTLNTHQVLAGDWELATVRTHPEGTP